MLRNPIFFVIFKALGVLTPLWIRACVPWFLGVMTNRNLSQNRLDFTDRFIHVHALCVK